MFVGRKDVIGAITEKHATIGQQHKRVALVGLAGVGFALPPLRERLLNCG
jgi:hypothetical protein